VETAIRLRMIGLNYCPVAISETLEFVALTGFADGCESLDVEDVMAIESIIEEHDWNAPRYSGRWALGPEGGAR
jgi:hypothetical protein